MSKKRNEARQWLNIHLAIFAFIFIIGGILQGSVTAYATEDKFDENTKWEDDEIRTWLEKNYNATSGTCGIPAIDNAIEDGDGTGEGNIFFGEEGNRHHISKDNIAKVRTALKGKFKNESAYDKVGEITDGIHIKADTSGAATMLSGFEGILNLLIGVILWGVFVGMTLFTACDICYIAFPVFRNKCEDMKQNGGAGTVKTGNGDRKLMFITDDAIYATTTCTIENGKSPYAVYGKRRAVSIVLLAIVVFVLMTDNIDLLVNISIRLVSGIMDVLSGLAS